MDNSAILRHVDHTMLSPTATWDDISTLCKEAILHNTASVCVPPAYVGRITREFGDSPVICTVIGFPLGYSVTAAKCAEAKAAIDDGAREIDMVINLTDVKNGDFAKVTDEIAAVRKAAGENILKVIIETCYLTEAEKIALCRCVTEGGADFIKTSTGFGTKGATLEDISLMKAHIGPGLSIKAAGGIRSREDMIAYLEAGCKRLGTSSAIKILAGKSAEGY